MTSEQPDVAAAPVGLSAGSLPGFHHVVSSFPEGRPVLANISVVLYIFISWFQSAMLTGVCRFFSIHFGSRGLGKRAVGCECDVNVNEVESH